MSYNHHVRTYQPNYGDDYMRNNFTHHTSTARASSPNNISFHGTSGSKKWLFLLLGILMLLLLAAITIIVLFAVGVIGSSEEQPGPGGWTSSPITDLYVDRSFLCTLFVLDQGSEYFEDPNNELTLESKRIASNAVLSVMMRSAIANMNLRTELVELAKSANDLRLVFKITIRVQSSSPIDTVVIRNTVLTPRFIQELEEAMNRVTIDKNPARILVQML